MASKKIHKLIIIFFTVFIANLVIGREEGSNVICAKMNSSYDTKTLGNEAESIVVFAYDYPNNQKEKLVIANPVEILYEGDLFRYVLSSDIYDKEWYQWSVDNKRLAKINERTGELEALKAGKVTVSAKAKRSGHMTNYQLTILPGRPSSPSEQKKSGSEIFSIPQGAKEIMGSDFSNWKELRQVVIPASIEKIYQGKIPGDKGGYGGIFRGNKKLESYCVDGNNRFFFSLDGVLYKGDIQASIPEGTYFKNNKSLYRYPVGKKETMLDVSGLKRIEEYAFADAYHLESIDANSYFIRKSVMEIGAYAFWGCENLKLLDLGGTHFLSKKELKKKIGRWNLENYPTDESGGDSTYKNKSVSIISPSMKEQLYVFIHGEMETGELFQSVYGVNYRTSKESEYPRLEIEYPFSFFDIGIGDRIGEEKYRVFVYGFRPEATYTFLSKDPEIVSITKNGTYAFLNGKKTGSTQLICKETYQGKTKVIDKVKITVHDPIDTKEIKKKMKWREGRFERSIVTYPKTGATYTYEVDQEGLTIKDTTSLSQSGNVQLIEAIPGIYNITIWETYQGKTREVYKFQAEITDHGWKLDKEENFYTGQNVLGRYLVENIEEDYVFHLEYDPDYFMHYKEDQTWDDTIIPIKTGDTIVTVYDDMNQVYGEESIWRKVGEVPIHITEEIPIVIKTKETTLAFFKGQTLDWTEIRSHFLIQYDQVPEDWGGDRILYEIETTEPEWFEVERTGAGCSVKALKTGETMLTLSAGDKSAIIHVVVYPTEEEYYEYLDSQKNR